MVRFKKSESNKCLVCNNEQKYCKIFDMSINRPFRDNENIVTFAICDNCLKEMGEYIESLLSKI